VRDENTSRAQRRFGPRHESTPTRAPPCCGTSYHGRPVMGCCASRHILVAFSFVTVQILRRMGACSGAPPTIP